MGGAPGGVGPAGTSASDAAPGLSRRCRPAALSNTQALQEPGDSTAKELLLCGVWTETSHRDRGAWGPES